MFVHDLQTGDTTRVSVDSSGTEGDSYSYEPDISADGRFVTFYSYATNLVTGDTNNTWDVFVHDRQTGDTALVSEDGSGTQGNDASWDSDISADGSLIAFLSRSTNLVTPDDNGAYYDVFVHETIRNQEPDCSASSASVDEIWPANHKFVAVNILRITDPDEDPITVNILSIFQDEPLNHLADGNTEVDGRGLLTATAEVRAERSAQGDGRFYHITFGADDGQGGTCMGVVTVAVPHDQGKKAAPPVDQGPMFDSTGP